MTRKARVPRTRNFFIPKKFVSCINTEVYKQNLEINFCPRCSLGGCPCGCPRSCSPTRPLPNRSTCWETCLTHHPRFPTNEYWWSYSPRGGYLAFPEGLPFNEDWSFIVQVSAISPPRYPRARPCGLPRRKQMNARGQRKQIGKGTSWRSTKIR